MHATATAIGVQERALSLSLSLSLSSARARWPSCLYPRPFAPAGTFSSISVRVIIAVSVPGDARICSTLRCSGMRHAILVDAYVATLKLDSSAPCLVEYVVGSSSSRTRPSPIPNEIRPRMFDVSRDETRFVARCQSCRVFTYRG